MAKPSAVVRHFIIGSKPAARSGHHEVHVVNAIGPSQKDWDSIRRLSKVPMGEKSAMIESLGVTSETFVVPSAHVPAVFELKFDQLQLLRKAHAAALKTTEPRPVSSEPQHHDSAKQMELRRAANLRKINPL